MQSAASEAIKKIAELEEKLERWKPKPPRSEVVNGENINLQYQKPKTRSSITESRFCQEDKA